MGLAGAAGPEATVRRTGTRYSHTLHIAEASATAHQITCGLLPHARHGCVPQRPRAFLCPPRTTTTSQHTLAPDQERALMPAYAVRGARPTLRGLSRQLTRARGCRVRPAQKARAFEPRQFQVAKTELSTSEKMNDKDRHVFGSPDGIFPKSIY